MDNCIFCKIAAGEIPSTTLYEDNDVRVIFDINPATKGHALVLPKVHYANVYDIPEELIGKAHIVAKKVAIALKEATGCDGVNILQNNEEAAGQTVFHLHIHVIPRYEDDNAKIGWKAGEANMEYLKELVSKLDI